MPYPAPCRPRPASRVACEYRLCHRFRGPPHVLHDHVRALLAAVALLAVALLAAIALLLSPYLLSAINPNEPQYVLPDAAYPPSLIASSDDYLLSAINLSEPQYALRNAAYQP